MARKSNGRRANRTDRRGEVSRRRSEQELRRRLHDQPNDARAWHELGLLYCDSGRLGEGIQFLHRAVQTPPPRAPHVLALARAFHRKGDIQQAIAWYNRAIELDPKPTEPYLDLGQCFMEARRYRKAIRCYEEVNRRQPNDALVLLNLGMALVSGMNTRRAIDVLEKVTAMKPELGDGHHWLAEACALDGQLERALNEYERSVKLHASVGESLSGVIECLASLGRYDEAWQRAEQAIADGQISPGLLNQYARVMRHRKESAKAVQVIEAAVEREKFTGWNRVSVDFALGGLHEDVHDYPAALAYYQRANSAFPASFDRAAFQQITDSLIEAFQLNGLAGLARSTRDSTRPCFIVGMPRSGTTLVEQILAAHPSVFGGGELPVLEYLTASLPNLLGREASYPNVIMGLTSEQLNRLADHYLAEIDSLDTDAERVTDKMPANFRHIGLIRQMIPHAAIIHCARNPLDTCLSIYATPLRGAHQYANDFESLAFAYFEYERLMRHWCSLYGDTICTVHYGRLVHSPREESQRLIEHCGLSWDERCLAFFEGTRSIATASAEQVRQPIYDSSLGRAAKFGSLLDPLREALEKFGVDPDSEGIDSYS